MRSLAVVAVGLLGGCAESVVARVELDPETASVVFRRAGCGGADTGELVAVDADQLRFDFPYCEGQQVALHEYGATLDALCLAPGPLSARDDADPLAVPDYARRGVLLDDEMVWTNLPPASRPIAEAVVPRIDVAGCAEASRCVGEVETCDCTETCALPEDFDVTPVELPRTECPPGWIVTNPRPGLEACRAYEEVACADGEVPIPGAGCTRLRAPCTDVWPGVPADVHVREGAVGGDGSQSMPFASLTAALDAVGDAAVVALAAGTYELPDVDRAAVTLIGACADEVTLLVPSALQIARARLHLADVRVALDDTLQLVSTTTATLERVVVVGDGTVNVAGHLTVRDSEFSSRLRVVGDAQVHRSFSDAGITVSGGRLELVGSSLVDGDPASLLVTQAAELVVFESRVAASSTAVQMIQGGRLQLRNSEIDGVALLFADDLDIIRSYLRGGSAEETKLGRCGANVDEAEVSDTIFEATESSHETLIVACSNMLRLKRVASVSGRGIRISNSNATLDDVRIFDSTTNGLFLEGGAMTMATRVHVTDVARLGIGVSDAWMERLQGGFHNFVDVRVERAGEAGIRFDDLAFATVRDAHITDVEGDGIVLVPNSVQAARWVFEKVAVDGAAGSSACEAAAGRPCEGVGVMVEGDYGDPEAAFAFRDVDVARARTGFQVRGNLELLLQRVRFRDNRVGLYANTPQVPRRAYVTDVTYQGNETALVFGD